VNSPPTVPATAATAGIGRANAGESAPVHPNAARAARPQHLLPAWLVGCTAGELLGFGATALVALLGIVALGRPTTTLGRLAALVVMTCAGTVEGATLGYFQWRVLRRAVPDLRARAWIGATALVAAGGWFLGMLGPLLAHLLGGAARATSAPAPRVSMAAYMALAAVFGLVAGALFGLAQWRVLRRHVRPTRGWVAANALGWALGLPWAYVAGRLGTGAGHVVETMGLALAGAVAMGLAVALVTGVYLDRVVAPLAGGSAASGAGNARHVCS
jgi:hypothetical protein